MLHTDGVIDAVGGDGRFGEQRLLETVRGARDAEDAVDRIGAALDAFFGDHADDTAVLAVERRDVAVRAGPADEPPTAARAPRSS